MNNKNFFIAALSFSFTESETKDTSINLLDAQKKRLAALYLKHNQIFDCLLDVSKLVNLTSDFKLPETIHKIKKLLLPNFSIKYYVKCEKCKKYTLNKEQKSCKINCSWCQSVLQADQHNFFAYINVLQQVKLTLQQDWDKIRKFLQNPGDDMIRDIHDGSIVQKIETQNDDDDSIRLSFVLNTDGASKFKSSSMSIWPILLYQCYLPPEERFCEKNIILAGLYVGENKPDFLEFFEPVVKEFKELNSKGFTMTLSNQEIKFKVHINHLTADLPAKSQLQNKMQFNGKYGCGYCYHPGIKTKNLSNNKHFIRYLAGKFSERTHEETVRIMKEITLKPSIAPVKGIKGVTPLIGFKGFDLIHGFCIDYLHCILLGVMKTLLNLWLDSKHSRTPFYIKKNLKKLLINRILSIKPLRLANRKPRSLKYMKYFKAHEFRDLLLFYLPVCLQGILPSSYLNHFRLLSSAVYILLGMLCEIS